MSPSEKNQKDESEMQDVEKNKYIEFYSQSYASFYNTTMEKDKSILAVSAGGIGFLITLINFSKEIKIFEYIVFLFASLSFVMAIFTIIHIFGKNAEYIIALTTESDDCDEKECKLKMLDKIATCAFALGIALSLVLGVTLSYRNIKKEVITVSEKKETSPTMEQLNESAAGASTIKKSVSGAAQIKPKVDSQSSGNNDSAESSKSISLNNTSNITKKDWCHDRRKRKTIC